MKEFAPEVHSGARIRLPSALCKPSLRTYFDWDDSGNDDYAARPKFLDLFAGGGGAAVGYYLAGFQVTGVDLKPQPHYPFRFIQADALEYLAAHWQEYDAIHASPPCQGYSIMHNLPWLRGRDYPLLILPTLEMLKGTGKPYMLENVMGARHGAKGLAKRGLAAHGLEAGWLCGQMFGLPFYRHRLFASNVFWMQPGHPRHTFVIRPGRGYGDSGDKANARMEVLFPWMTKREARQAIPPCYTTYVGAALLEAVANKGGAARK